MVSVAALFLWVLPSWGSDAVDLVTIEQAAEMIDDNWVGSSDPDALTQAAVRGMLEYLDAMQGHPGNVLVTPSTAGPKPGWRQGIGVEYLALPGHGMLVTQVFDSSPADRAGLQNGDTVTAMGTWSFAGRSRPEIHAIVLNYEDPQMELEVMSRDGKRQQVALERGPFRIAPIRTMGRPGIPALRVHHFSQGTAEALGTALGEGTDCLILDLRDNPGGDLAESVASAGLFLPTDAVVTRLRHKGKAETVLTAEGSIPEVGPMAILVNGGTRQMAELFTAALQSHGRAVVVGVPTAGVGGMSGEHVLAEGTRLRIVDTTLYAPRGQPWTGEGLLPDVIVEDSRATMVSLHSAPPDLQFEAAARLLDCSN